jgi:hypothetical protein
MTMTPEERAKKALAHNPMMGSTPVEVMVAHAIREAEQAAYERAAKLCGPHKDDDRMDRQIKAQIAQSIRALGKQEA